MQLAGKVALVTGGSRGLGFLIARELLHRGTSVAICARDGSELERAREALQGELRPRDAETSGLPRVSAVPCDVSDKEQVQRLIDTVVADHGGLDVLVTNAGTISAAPVESLQVSDFEDSVNVLFWGVAYPTLYALPHLQASHGRVVTITSIGGKVAPPHLVPYACGKFAAVGFSEGLSAEARRLGIGVTTVVPGLMRTGSPINAFFGGNQRAEYAWFTLADSIPGLSIDADRAARQVVSAIENGRSEVAISLLAKVAMRVHGLMPATTTKILGLVDELLPQGQPSGTSRGAHLDTNRSGLFRQLTALTRRAARGNQEVPGPIDVAPPLRSAEDPHPTSVTDLRDTAGSSASGQATTRSSRSSSSPSSS